MAPPGYFVTYDLRPDGKEPPARFDERAHLIVTHAMRHPVGRRPIGDKAMTAAERQRRMRQRQKDEVTWLYSGMEKLTSDDYFAERVKVWCPGQRGAAAEQLLKGLDPTPTIRWGTRLGLTFRMIQKLSTPEWVELVAAAVKCIKSDALWADLVQALRPIDRKRLAAALANCPSRRAPDSAGSLASAPRRASLRPTAGARSSAAATRSPIRPRLRRSRSPSGRGPS
jgi:hypothetical protein